MCQEARLCRQNQRRRIRHAVARRSDLCGGEPSHLLGFRWDIQLRLLRLLERFLGQTC